MSGDYPLALTFDRYRRLLDGDARLAVQAAMSGLDGEVAYCPGWTGADAAYHLAEVYLHKVAAIRDGVMPQPSDGADSHGGWPPAELRDRPPAEALASAYAALVEQFDQHSPSDAAHTWWPDDQSVGFWIRRMAHETAVHRTDLESAAGQGVPPAPIDAELALDGIDEVLCLMLEGDWSELPQPQASGRTVEIDCAGHSWAITLQPERVVVRRDPADDASARVSAEAAELLLWLWGRAPAPSGVTGELSAVTELRRRLALATE